jgi:hypothetical protein
MLEVAIIGGTPSAPMMETKDGVWKISNPLEIPEGATCGLFSYIPDDQFARYIPLNSLIRARKGKTMSRMITYIPATSWTKGKGHRVSFVIENEAGHAPNGNAPEGGEIEPWYWGNPNDEAKSYELAKKTARAYNQKRKISEEEEMRILISSMIG